MATPMKMEVCGGQLSCNIEHSLRCPEHGQSLDKKARIGQKAAEFIQDGDSIILDAGSTTHEIAKNLGQGHRLRILTNALHIAVLLRSQPSFQVVVTGGELQPVPLSLAGENTVKFFQQFHVDKLFLAAAGISWEAGLTYHHLYDVAVKKAMLEAAREVFLVADSTKIGKISFAALGGVEHLQYFITDSGIRDDDRKRFEQRGIRLILA